jgi:hypothetical protein
MTSSEEMNEIITDNMYDSFMNSEEDNIMYGGASYPDIDDPSFQQLIKEKFKNFEIPSRKPSFKEICFPEQFKHQLPQGFVGQFINPKTDYKGLLVYHRIGAGKTCAAVLIALAWCAIRRVIFIVPASLIGNVYKEFRSECAGSKYMTTRERERLKKLKVGSYDYDMLINEVNKRIDKDIHILSFHKYVRAVRDGRMNLKNSLVIVDEVQNVVSEKGSTYNTIYNSFLESPPSTRIVVMSATPIFDKPVELALTLNLLKPKKPIPVGAQFNELFLKKHKDTFIMQNVNLFKQYVRGYVSYSPGAPSHAFPEKKFKVIKCKMSSFQYDSYKTVMNNHAKFDFEDILNLSNDFFIGARMMSNVCFPNKKIGIRGFQSWSSQKTKLEKIERYSTKIHKFLKIIKNVKGPNILYSNFRGYGGIESTITALKSNGYKNILEHGPGKKRYGVWSGEESMKDKEYTRDIYNQPENVDGSKLHVMLLSPAGKEGLSLLRTSTLTILEPYWNSSRIDQIIGRGIRFCSHKDMPKDKRVVKVYLLLAVLPSSKKKSIDQYIYETMNSKNKLMEQFYKAMEQSSVDYKLFANASKFIE